MAKQNISKAINDLRDTIVGKVPLPNDQVDQITLALLYKFMDDMDQVSIEMGGVATFFNGEYEQYSWKKIMSNSIGSQKRYNLYTEGLDKFYLNSALPDTFRAIFKNATVPYKDPETLTNFLKIIDENFNYNEDSEQLGDAYELLINIMGSSGDLGMFRTPRNIIDLIVSIISPKKDDRILDPACGTAGFLISAYKYILSQNLDENGKSNLTFDEKNNILKNINGYDIAPSMVKISEMNMFLHGAAEPKIHEYDTLTSAEKWGDKYECILANPPFMTPKGGIVPHNKFSIKSNKSEILFVDYIISHLTSNGKAGIIVPDGVAYQTGKAYKAIRKETLENGLFGVISLPKGIFNPYSGVKTTILLIDKCVARDKKDVIFINLTNDGYSLGAQRKPIKGSQLDDIKKIMTRYKNGEIIEDIKDFCYIVDKDIIIEKEYSFVFNHYKPIEKYTGKYDLYKINEICNIFNGSTPLKSNDEYWENGVVNWFTVNDIKNQGREIYDTEMKITEKALKETSVKLLPVDTILICCTASVGEYAISKVPLTTNQQFNGLVIKDEYKNKIDPYYLYLLSPLFKEKLLASAGSTSFDFVSVKKLGDLEVPVPDIETQRKIIDTIQEKNNKIKKLTEEINSLNIEITNIIKNI